MELAANSGEAFGPDATAVLLNDAAAKGESKASSTQGAGVGSVPLLEAFEDALELLGGDTPALVLDGKADLCRSILSIGGFISGLCGEVDGGVWRREFDGVGYQLVEDLEDSFLIAQDLGASRIDANGDARLAGCGVRYVVCPAEQVDGFDRQAV